MVIVFLVLSVLPLAVNFWADLPYEPLKIQSIELTAMASGLAVLVCILANRNKCSAASIVEKLNWLDFAVILWLLSLILSTIFSVSPYMSLWGSDVRGTGLLYYASLTVLYLVVRLFSGWKDWSSFTRSSCIVAAVVSAYGLFQWLGVDHPALTQAFPLYGRSGPMRAFSTLGHPNFLGSYLAIFIPVGIYVWFVDARRHWRLIGALAVTLSAFANLLTYSRGAWLACLGGVLSVYFFWQRPNKPYPRMHLVVASMLVIIAIGGYFLIQPKLAGSANSFAYRMGTALDVRQGSVLARVAEWKHALYLIPQRPVFGYGLETYVEYSGERKKNPMERNRDWAEADPSVADRLHNQLFDIGWSSGLVGLMTFGFLITVLFQRLKKLFKENTEMRQWISALTGSLVAYLLSNLTGFDFSLSGLWFYILVAAIASAEMMKKDKALER